MADLCRGSGSSPRPLTAAVISGGTAAVAEFIAKRVDRGAAALIGTIVGGSTILTSQLCASPAPDIPTLTAQDYINGVAPPDTATFVATVQKFTAWWLGQYWSEICQCNDGQPPGVPTLTTPPPVGDNTGLPPAGGGQPCWSYTDNGQLSASQPFADITTRILPTTQTVTVTSSISGAPSVAQLIPAGTTAFTESYTVAAAPGAGTAPLFNLECFDNAGGSLGVRGGFGCIGCSFSHTVTLPPGTASWSVYCRNVNTVPVSYSYSISFFCNGVGPTQLTQPCCPPDPTLDLKLTQILNLLLQIQPSAGGGYTRGTVHAGLSGSGSLSVSGLAGLEIVVTTNVSPRPPLEGNPMYIWDQGWLSASDGGGMLQEQRLTRQHQIWVPREAPTANTWGFFLFPGVVATITELRAI